MYMCVYAQVLTGACVVRVGLGMCLEHGMSVGVNSPHKAAQVIFIGKLLAALGVCVCLVFPSYTMHIEVCMFVYAASIQGSLRCRCSCGLRKCRTCLDTPSLSWTSTRPEPRVVHSLCS